MSVAQVTVEAAFGFDPFESVQGLFLSGTAYASTPDDPAVEVTGAIDIRAFIRPTAISTPAVQAIVTKFGGVGDYQWRFLLRDDGALVFNWSADGTTAVSVASTVNLFGVDFSDGEPAYVRVTHEPTGHAERKTKFYYSVDGATWTQLGVDVDGGATGAIHDGTHPIWVGRDGDDPSFQLAGFIHWVEIRDGVNGTIVARPDFTEAGPWQPDDAAPTARDDAEGVTWTLEVDATVNPGYADLTDRAGDVQGIHWEYGRSDERDLTEAGKGSVGLDNSDRALDPTNQASPFWPNLKPTVRIRVRATHNATTYVLFEGYADAWPPEWSSGEYGWTVVPLVDGFDLLSLARTSAAYSQEASGTRIGNLLDAAGWPAVKRDVDTGQSDVQAYVASDRIVLNAIQDAAQAESGIFYIAPNGDATFRDRHSRVTGASQATFGDDAGELPWERIALSYDKTTVYNDIAVTPEGLGVQRAEDDKSIKTHGRRWLDRTMIVTSELEAASAAKWLLRRYKDPRLRIESMVLAGHLDDNVMEQILTRVVGDRVTVKARPPGGGDPISREVFIERVVHDIEGLTWFTTWQLFPATAETVWLAGVPGFSEAGLTTVASY